MYLILWIVLPIMDGEDVLSSARKLYRSRTDKMIGGVCGGLALAFNTDPTVMRLVFIGLAILGLASVLPYIVLWIIIPSEPYY